MRIAIDCRLWDQTGVGRYTRNLIYQLQDIDKVNQYVLFVRKEDYEKIKSKIKNKKFKIVKVNIPWHSAKEQLKFSGILSKENPDLVHFPYFSVPYFYNKPYVVTIHDLIINHYPTGKASTLFTPLYYLKFFSYKLVIANAAKKAIKIITPSFTTKEEVVDHLKVSREKIFVTNEACDDMLQEDTAEAIKGIPETYLLYVGNAYPHKNLERLTDAFNKIKGKTPGLKLIMVGNIDYFYLKLKKRVKDMGLENEIIFFGKATDGELSYLYKNAKALIMPSLMEGFGLPVLEAMANKCFVLCSDIGSLREVAGADAFYFDPKDKDSISSSILSAYSEKLDKKVLERGYKRARGFSWEKMARETLRVYESCFGLRQGQ